jgi:hypothetical protein
MVRDCSGHVANGIVVHDLWEPAHAVALTFGGQVIVSSNSPGQAVFCSNCPQDQSLMKS